MLRNALCVGQPLCFVCVTLHHIVPVPEYLRAAQFQQRASWKLVLSPQTVRLFGPNGAVPHSLVSTPVCVVCR